MHKIDPRELRSALGAFMTGVTVVTTIDHEGTPTGFTANSFTSVSLDKPLVLFCLAGNSSNRAIYLNAGKFAINVLAEGQRAISSTFSALDASDRFAGVDWSVAKSGSPILGGAAAWFDCLLYETLEAGDHVIVIGEVLAFDHTAANPLGYWKGNYVSALLERRAGEASSRKGRVGVILEHDAKILLLEDPHNGQLQVPCGHYMGSSEQPDSLLGVLASHGISAEIGFVFSVFEDGIQGESERVLVYYRGTTENSAINCAGVQWLPLGDIPWSRLSSKDVRTMLHRYVDESLEGRYSVYVGDSEQGEVCALK